MARVLHSFCSFMPICAPKFSSENNMTSFRFPILSRLGIFLSIIAQFASALNDTRACYNVSNDIEPGHYPCVSPETKAISHCCSTVDTCIGDTLCLSQWGTLYVGSCTVENWLDGTSGRGDCPKYCASWYSSTRPLSIISVDLIDIVQSVDA
jgi:hypothetical protein